nr:hypothetical protein [Tanacetum cinerariifolium]
MYDLDNGILDVYTRKLCYNDCEKMYAEAVIFINKRLIRLINVNVEQWLDLKYGDHTMVSNDVNESVIATGLIRSYKKQFDEYMEIKKQKKLYVLDAGFKTYDEYKDAWIYEWNKEIPWVVNMPWLDYGPSMEPSDDIEHIYLPGEIQNGDVIYFESYDGYENLKEGKLKDEALNSKAIFEGSKGVDEESRAYANSNYNPYLDVSRIFNDHARKNNHCKTQKDEGWFDERELMGDDDDDISDLEDYLIRKDPNYYVNGEEERSKERRCKLLEDYSRPNHIPTLSQITHTTIPTVYFFDQTPHAMVLVDHTGWKLRHRQWTGTTEQLIEELESTYDNVPNMFSIRIHHGGKFLAYPGRMYVSGRVDIFDMVDIDLFNVVALNMMVLKLGYTCESKSMFYNYLRPLTSLDVGLYALACEEDVCCLATRVRSFKLIKVYIKHGATVLDSYLRAPRFKETLDYITDEPAGSIAANRTEKILLLTWHESSETTKEPDCILTPPTNESVITYTHDINLSFVSQQASASHVIDDVMRQLSFDESELDGEAGFADVPGSGVDSLGLSHDESFGVDDFDLNLNKPVNLNVSQVETQFEHLVFEELDVGPTQEPILAEVSTQEPIVAEVSTQEPIVAKVSTEAPIVKEVGTQEFIVEDVVIKDYVSFREDGEDAEQGNGQEDESAPTDGQFFYDDEGIDTAYETKYDVQSSEDACTYDDDVDEDFLVDKENKIVEPDVDVHLFGEDVDVINADGFDSNPGNDEERNYMKRRLAELRTKMEGDINASGQWKYGLCFNEQKSQRNRTITAQE